MTGAPAQSVTETGGVPRRGLRWLLIAQSLSMVGDALLGVALALYVLDESGSPALSAATALARIVPSVLFGALGGTLVDRTDRRTLLWRITLLRAALVLPLLLVPGGLLPLAGILGLELVRALMAQLSGPAVGASLPVVVEPDDLPRANAQLAARNVVIQLAAPTAGAALYAAHGLSLVILINAGLYLAASVTWLTLPKVAPVPRSGHRVWKDTWAGFQLVRDDDVLRPLLMALTMALIGLTLELAVLVPFIRQDLGGSPTTVGLLTSLEAIGGLLAAVVFTWLHRRLGGPALFRIGMWGMPAATTGFLVAQTASQAIPGVIAAGFLLSLLTAALQVHLQQNVPHSHLGRVLGILGSTIALAALLGTSLAVGLSLVLDLRTVLGVAVAIELLGIVAYLAGTRPDRPQPKGR